MAHPLPALLLALFFARSLTLVPRSLLLNRMETLATQARFMLIANSIDISLQSNGDVFFTKKKLRLCLHYTGYARKPYRI